MWNAKRAASRSGNYNDAKGSRYGTKGIVSDLERGYTWAGIALSVSFALMGVLGAWFGW